MDTSPEYVLMCKQAGEIQKSWNPAAWDYCVCTGNPDQPVVILSGYATDAGIYGHEADLDGGILWCEYDGGFGSEITVIHFWLPRLDQLGEIVKDFYKGYPDDLKLLLLEFHFFTESVFVSFKSLEQYWLAFVMKEKYNKSWTGAEWK